MIDWKAEEQRRLKASEDRAMRKSETKILANACGFRPRPIHRLPRFWKALCPSCELPLIKNGFGNNIETWTRFDCTNCDYKYASYYFQGTD